MNYQQLRFTSTALQVEAFSEQLESLGALGVTWEDAFDSPIYEPEPHTNPLWDHVIITALFAKEAEIEPIIATLQKNHGGIIPIERTLVEDENWIEKSLAHFKPIAISKDLWICPSWIEIDSPHATIVRLNPGLAFGTGEHATTQMILAYMAAHPPRNNTVLDFGCGSGILAITACMLGATSVYAVDIDEQAFIATQNNAQLNHIAENKIHISFPDALVDCQVDLLLANIFLTPLLKLHKKFANLLKPHGYLLLSGVLASQLDEITTAYRDDFHLEVINQQDDWLLLRGTFKKN
jgi:ribosomal protein L11 methyltransferase